MPNNRGVAGLKPVNAMTPAEFQQCVLAWFDLHGRKDLPWQHPITPYRVWISETMLQQTQVSTVIPYFLAFIAKFPNEQRLAAAPLDDVLHSWSGLGYYARARNLHKAAQLIVEGGHFPDTLAELVALPGIGRSTAGAILSIAFNQSQSILDGNVKRILSRCYAISGWPGKSDVSKTLWTISAALTPDARVADYTQAIMDLGATLCTRSKPRCDACPIAAHCLAKLGDNVLAYPTPKPGKPLPVKHTFLLLLTDPEQRIWLEKRPAKGIWGGLWSLPEFADTEQARQWCRQRNLVIGSERTLPDQRHSFSHYHLAYTPLCIQTENPTHFVMEAAPAVWYNAAWFNARQISELGLPAPIKSLLQTYNNEEHDD